MGPKSTRIFIIFLWVLLFLLSISLSDEDIGFMNVRSFSGGFGGYSL